MRLKPIRCRGRLAPLGPRRWQDSGTSKLAAALVCATNMPTPDWIAVLVAGLAMFLLGGLWYSPLLFARAWMPLAHPGKTEDDLRKQGAGAASYVFAFVAGLVAIATVAYFAEAMGGGLWDGVRAGLYCAVGIVATTFGTTYLFGGKPMRLYLIDAGYQMVGLVLGGLIYGAWPW